jgi:hypothetical protein
MKMRIVPLAMATLALCSASAAFAGDTVRASNTHVTKSTLRASRAMPRLQDANKDGATLVPIVLAAAAGAGGIIYFATRHDQKASR